MIRRTRALSTIAGVIVIVVVLIVAGGAVALYYSSTSGGNTSTTSTTTTTPSSSSSATSTGVVATSSSSASYSASSSTPSSSSSSPSSPSSSSTSTSVTTTTPVTFISDFGIGGRQAGIFAAKDQGFYAQQGLQVTIQSGSGSLNSAQLVAAGKADFADVDAGTFAVAVEGGITNITAIMVLEQANSNAMMSFSPIPNPKSFENKTFGTSPGNSGTFLAQGVMALNGANYSSMKVVTVSAATLTSAFLQNQFQLSPTAVDNLLAVAQSGAGGRTIYTLNYTNWGLQTYDFLIIASNSFLNSNPGIASAFVKGTIQGVQWAMSNPTQAVGFEAKDVPSFNATIGIKQWKTAERFFATPFAVKNYGTFNSTQFLAGEMFYLNATGTKLTVPLNNVFTNRFVPTNQTLPIPAVPHP